MKLTKQQKETFADKFLETYLMNGFGVMPKAEVDILIFHLISQSEELEGKTNYEIANKLLITETKVKSLRLNSALKYNQANHKAVLANIVSRITDVMQKPDFQDGEISITIENPVEQRELEHAIKKAGRNFKKNLNSEIFNITPIALFELIVSNFENPEAEFKRFVQANITDKSMQKELVDSSLTLRQRVNKFGEELNDNAGLIGMLGTAVGAL